MKPKPWRLEWVSADKQGYLPMGEFASRLEASAAMSHALAELLKQCAGDEQLEARIIAGSFVIKEDKS